MSWLGLAPTQFVLTGLAINSAWWLMPHHPGKEAYVLQACTSTPLPRVQHPRTCLGVCASCARLFMLLRVTPPTPLGQQAGRQPSQAKARAGQSGPSTLARYGAAA